jgi:FtsZ-interacting cell division protein ZipA
MNTNLIIVVAIVVVVLVVVAFFLQQRTKSQKLHSKFGGEYDRAVEETGSRRKAESVLHDRAKRLESFNIHPLAAPDRDRFVESWQKVQSEFVDDPKSAVVHADVLLGDVMSTRGYPVGDFAQRAADLSVDHPVVVSNYRAAHDIAIRQAGGNATTEDLRQAMVHYKGLFQELVTDAATSNATAA